MEMLRVSAPQVATPSTPMPACAECRRRKLGCSKELPSCKECRRLGTPCVYEAREKPGLKTGAVENLNRRVDKIEQLLQQVQQRTESLHQSSYSASDSSHDGCNGEPNLHASDLLRRFEKEMREMREFRRKYQDQVSVSASSRHSATPDRQSYESPGHPVQSTPPPPPPPRPRLKRKRCNSGGVFSWGERVLESSFYDDLTDKLSLSPTELLDAVVDKYFSQVHPWLPILHEIRFRQILSKQLYSANLEVVLHAMIVSAVRFVRCSDNATAPNHSRSISQLTKSSRDWVMLNALSSLSLENLQALSIIAFDDIGCGEAARTWSIVGSLTRTVEYLQLSIEVEEGKEKPLAQPCHSLSPPKDWTETETRRRVFWTIFTLDRFCSVVTGWNTSLTSDDVHRRLPVDGFLWRKQEEVLAPFFGIWDKSAGRIGNSITFLPTHYPSLSPAAIDDHQSPTTIADFGQNSNAEAISTIGAFAYCIEATESMSRVTTYFLQQKVNLLDQKQIGRWLTRFKELDLRLVHWKMFLPQKWKDTNISRKATDVIMDPNLTLAHITHNASMILLHQLIAYPPADWDWATRLPSRCSADTCQAASQETSSITENYLKSPTQTKIVNGQFVFCVFIAARLLLVHWRYYQEQRPLPDFFALLESLDTISTRWQGALKSNVKGQLNLAAKYARLLRQMYERCNEEPGYRIDVLAYANEMGNDSIGAPDIVSADEEIGIHDKDDETTGGNVNSNQPHRHEIRRAVQVQHAQDMAQHAEQMGNVWQTSQPRKKVCVVSSRPPLAPTQETPTSSVANVSQTQSSINAETDVLANGSGLMTAPVAAMAMDDLTSISQMFLDQQFLDMDRVISYDEGLFTANMGWWDQGI